MRLVVAEAARAVPPPARRGLSRVVAAGYVGVSPTKFDQLVEDGLMPKPKTIGRRRVWDLRAVDQAFDALPSEDDEDRNPWDA